MIIKSSKLLQHGNTLVTNTHNLQMEQHKPKVLWLWIVIFDHYTSFFQFCHSDYACCVVWQATELPHTH